MFYLPELYSLLPAARDILLWGICRVGVLVASGRRQQSDVSAATGRVPADLYALLGVSETATPEQIKRGYRAAMMRIHPDRAEPNERERAELQARELNEAYRVLTDPALRRQYDTERRSAVVQDEIMNRYFGGFGVPGGSNDVYEEIMEIARQENRRQRAKHDRHATTSLLTMFLILLAAGIVFLLIWGAVSSAIGSLS